MNRIKKFNVSRLSPLVGFSFFLASLIVLPMACRPIAESDNPYPVNTAHLDTLYGEINVGGNDVGFVHIYSEHPDYHMVGDDDEGFACVDDASRAAIFYLRQYKISDNPEHLRKAEMLLKFLLVMQAPNGYYYNFIWPDGSIHKEGVTTVAEPNWWSWRVLWAFSEAMDILGPDRAALLSRIKAQRNILVRNIMREPSFQSERVDTVEGLIIPAWLPGESGADQASLILMALAQMLEETDDGSEISRDSLISVIRHFADGIVMMQIHAKDSIQDGAFLSWANLWHAYGNSQAYALLKVSQVLDDQRYAASALYEIDHFYPALIDAGGFDFFWVKKADSTISRNQTQVFSQIAYGKRPMVFAAIAAFEITGDDKYLLLAKELGKWFAGGNIANTVMYDPVSGRGYDGIISATEINKNAGAESTIESLLSIQALAKYGK
jgi:hypothetical protein